MSDPPQVTLDTTLADLYALDNSDSPSSKTVALVLCAANSEIAPTSMLARNTKFLYQDSTFSTTPADDSLQHRKEIQHSVAVKYLSLVPQRDAFAAGNMPVILFSLDGLGRKPSARSKEEAERTVGSLIPPQRPRLLFFPGPEQIVMESNGIDVLAAKMEFDGLEGFPVAVDLETHYFLNSKAAICSSGLPSAKSQLLELNELSPPRESCCSVCQSTHNALSIPTDCNGPRSQWLAREINRTLTTLSKQHIPFVLKNQQTFGGGGTFVVTTPHELAELTLTLSNHVLPKLFSQVTPSNAHLKPATLILSEMITDPVGDWGLTFFVTRTGKCVFLAVTEQVVDDSKAWIGSTVKYAEQEHLEQKFTTVMRQIGAWLHKHKYYGPCGADILEAASKPDDGSDSTTTLSIVDLNVRTSGSLVLALMKGHFWKRRGLAEASSFSVSVKMTRDAFAQEFEELVLEGRMVVVSWYEDDESGVSYGNVVIGARDKQELERDVARVKKLAPEIHF